MLMNYAAAVADMANNNYYFVLVNRENIQLDIETWAAFGIATW